MAEQTRLIRNRIKSINSTKQITRAMEMVATSKIKKAQDRIEASRPYAITMMETMQDIAARVSEAGVVSHPLLEVREAKKIAVLAITSNRGLAGAFNANIIRRAESLILEKKGEGKDVRLMIGGKKGISYFRFMGYQLAQQYEAISDRPTFEEAKMIADELIDLYTYQEIDEAHIIFNHFRSVMEQHPMTYQILPIPREITGGGTYHPDMLFEPEATQILNKMLPNYVEILIFRALLESAASEHGARRTAMKAATDNAEEMITHLVRSLNRARQAQITKELAEIVGGADALKQAKTG